MNEKDLIKSFGGLDEKLLERSEKSVGSKLRYYAAAAAAVLIVVGAAIAITLILRGKGGRQSGNITADASSKPVYTEPLPTRTESVPATDAPVDIDDLTFLTEGTAECVSSTVIAPKAVELAIYTTVFISNGPYMSWSATMYTSPVKAGSVTKSFTCEDIYAADPCAVPRIGAFSACEYRFRVGQTDVYRAEERY